MTPAWQHAWPPDKHTKTHRLNLTQESPLRLLPTPRAIRRLPQDSNRRGRKKAVRALFDSVSLPCALGGGLCRSATISTATDGRKPQSYSAAAFAGTVYSSADGMSSVSWCCRTRACQQRGIKAGVGNDCSGDPTECQRAATSPSWPAASVVQPRDLVEILHC
jgi:hypothetical protein